MKVIKATGLTPVTMLKASLPYRKGAIHGFYPAQVAKMLAAGDCELVDIPEGMETEEVVVHIPDNNPPAAPAAADPRDALVVPDDWETMHVLKRSKLAKKLDSSVTTDEEAKAAIAAELERRAAPQP